MIEHYVKHSRLVFRSGQLAKYGDRSSSWKAGYRDGINSNPIAVFFNNEAPTDMVKEYLDGYKAGVNDIKHEHAPWLNNDNAR